MIDKDTLILFDGIYSCIIFVSWFALSLSLENNYRNSGHTTWIYVNGMATYMLGYFWLFTIIFY